MRDLVCIVCPRGCTLHVEGEGETLQVTGNGCKRGEAFAISEQTAPMRTLCTTVRTVFPDVPVLPVRVSAEIPKDKIFSVMGIINAVTLEKPVAIGGVILENVLGLGVDVVAASNLLRRTGP